MICYIISTIHTYIYNIVVSIVYYNTKNQCQRYVTMMMLVIKLVRRWYIILQLTLNVLYYKKMSYFPFNFLVNICISFHWNSSFFPCEVIYQTSWISLKCGIESEKMIHYKSKLEIIIEQKKRKRKRKYSFVFVKCMKYVLIIFMNDWCLFNE